VAREGEPKKEGAAGGIWGEEGGGEWKDRTIRQGRESVGGRGVRTSSLMIFQTE